MVFLSLSFNCSTALNYWSSSVSLSVAFLNYRKGGIIYMGLCEGK